MAKKRLSSKTKRRAITLSICLAIFCDQMMLTGVIPGYYQRHEYVVLIVVKSVVQLATSSFAPPLINAVGPGLLLFFGTVLSLICNAIWTLAVSSWVYFMSHVIQGCAAMIFTAGGISLLIDCIPADKRAPHLDGTMSAYPIGAVAGMALGGLLLQAGTAVPLFIIALLNLFNLVFQCMLIAREVIPLSRSFSMTPPPFESELLDDNSFGDTENNAAHAAAFTGAPTTQEDADDSVYRGFGDDDGESHIGYQQGGAQAGPSDLDFDSTTTTDSRPSIVTFEQLKDVLSDRPVVLAAAVLLSASSWLAILVSRLTPHMTTLGIPGPVQGGVWAIMLLCALVSYALLPYLPSSLTKLRLVCVGEIIAMLSLLLLAAAPHSSAISAAVALAGVSLALIYGAAPLLLLQLVSTRCNVGVAVGYALRTTCYLLGFVLAPLVGMFLHAVLGFQMCVLLFSALPLATIPSLCAQVPVVERADDEYDSFGLDTEI